MLRLDQIDPKGIVPSLVWTPEESTTLERPVDQPMEPALVLGRGTRYRTCYTRLVLSSQLVASRLRHSEPERPLVGQRILAVRVHLLVRVQRVRLVALFQEADGINVMLVKEGACDRVDEYQHNTPATLEAAI